MLESDSQSAPIDQCSDSGECEMSFAQALHLMRLWREDNGDEATRKNMLETLHGMQTGRPRVPTQKIIDALKKL